MPLGRRLIAESNFRSRWRSRAGLLSCLTVAWVPCELLLLLHASVTKLLHASVTNALLLRFASHYKHAADLVARDSGSDLIAIDCAFRLSGLLQARAHVLRLGRQHVRCHRRQILCARCVAWSLLSFSTSFRACVWPLTGLALAAGFSVALCALVALQACVRHSVLRVRNAVGIRLWFACRCFVSAL